MKIKITNESSSYCGKTFSATPRKDGAITTDPSTLSKSGHGMMFLSGEFKVIKK